MQSKTSLLGGAAIGVLLALGVSATADAKTSKHHHHKAAAAAPSATNEAIEGLTAEVEDLKARLQAESDARTQDETQLKSAQEDAAQARAEAQAAHTQVQEQIQTIPGEVKHEIAAEKKPSWADNTSISGQVFADLTDINQTPKPAAGTGTASSIKNGFGADIKRAYIGIDHKFNDMFSANVTLDFNSGYNTNGNNANSVAGSSASLYTKYAYVQAKISDALILQVGEAKMPWAPFVETVYGYRYVEKTATDDYGFANTADWGVFANGKLFDGMVGYAVAAVDGGGGGYKKPEHSETMDVEARVNATYMGFTVAAGGYEGRLGNDINNGPHNYHTASRWDILAAYVNPLFRIGGEYFSANDWTRVTKSTGDKSQGYSVFGAYNFTKQISVFGRYDWLQPSQDLASSIKGDYYNVGVGYEPVSTVDFALVYKHDHLNGPAGTSLSDANATLTVPLTGHANYDEVGLFTQFKF
jgi:hypothetical protein